MAGCEVTYNDDDFDQREPEPEEGPFLGELRWYLAVTFTGTRKNPSWDHAYEPALQQWNGDCWQEIPTVYEPMPEVAK